MSDSFMHKHQASLDSQREEAEINWLFPEPDNDEILENLYEEIIEDNPNLEHDEAINLAEEKFNELVVPDIHNALEIKSYKETVESEIEKCMKKLKDLTIEEKVNVLTKITKLKKDLKKL